MAFVEDRRMTQRDRARFVRLRHERDRKDSAIESTITRIPIEKSVAIERRRGKGRSHDGCLPVFCGYHVGFCECCNNERLDFFRGDWSGIVVTLDPVARVSSEKIELIFGFRPLGADIEIEVVRHCDDRLDERCIVVLRDDVGDERLVDLERVDRKALEISER